MNTFKLTQTGPETQDILDEVNVLREDVDANIEDIEQLQELYQAFINGGVVIIQPTDTWPVANPTQTAIYRVIDRENTPPEYYADYMWNGTSFVKMAQYDNNIDDEPTADSDNLVKSGGVVSYVEDYVATNGSAFDISVANAVGGVPAKYADLTDALGTNGANVPSAVRKGGMSVKFIQQTPASYSVVVTEDVAEAPSGGVLLDSDPDLASGTYTASDLTELSSESALPTSVGDSKTYYFAVSGDTTTYTTLVVTLVQNSDNKYVQYRLMNPTWNTVVTNWQGVDDEPIAGSDNLVKSGGIKDSIDTIDSKITYIPDTELKHISSYYNILYNIVLQSGHKYYVKHLSGYKGNFFTGNGSDAVTLVTNQWVEFTPDNTQKPITYSSAEPANMPRVIVADSDGVYNEIQSLDTKISTETQNRQNADSTLDGKIYNTNNRIDDIVGVIVSLGEIVGTQRRIITPQGLVVDGSWNAQYVSDVIDISEYHKLSLDITCPTTGDNAAAFAFYDDIIDTSTGQGLVSVVQMPQVINDGLIVNIPSGATKVVIGYLINSSVGWYGVKNLKGMRDATLHELNSKIDTEIQNRRNADSTLEGKIDNNLVATDLIPLIYYSQYAKYYLDSDGVLQEQRYSNRFITNPITPTPMILNISGNRFYPMVLFYDDNIDFETGAGFISGISFTVDINTDVEITQDMIPVNATKMVFNGIMQNNSQYFGVEAFGYEILNNNQLFQRLKDYANITNITIYLSPNGNDANDGLSPSKPKKTIQTVIDAGYKNLILESGTYTNQQIVINGVDGLSIVCNSSSNESNLFESHVRRSHAKIDNSIDVEFENYTTNVKRVTLSVDENHSYYKVFISQELPIIYNGGGYYGQTPTYNAILWEITSNILTCKKVVPVLTVTECENTAGTFTYDGTYLYIHPFDNSFEGKTYKRLNLDAKQRLVDIRNSNNIYIQGVDIAFAPYIDLYTNVLTKTTFRDCVFSFTCYGATCEITNSDIDFHSCIATHAANDGWGVAGNGNCSLYNCDAIHCYDDGVSHHDSTTGVIDGGIWSYNGKGGITPSYGSEVNVQNAVCHHNKYGCYYLASGDRITNAQVLLQNVLMYDNTTKDLKVGGYYVISHNCQYGTKEVDISGTLDEYGNSVIQ